MGLKVKGGMWCDSCQRPVAGQKSTKKVAKLSGMVLTGGLYPALPSAYHCPFCGQPVRKMPRTTPTPTAAQGARPSRCSKCGGTYTYSGTAFLGVHRCPHCRTLLVAPR